MIMPLLSLGDLVFRDLEIPARIEGLGGKQHIAVQDFIGGGRNVDVLGGSYDPLTWNGIFTGSDAVQRAQYLDNLRVQGKALPLEWNYESFTVVIQHFNYTFEKPFIVPYKIECVVVENNSEAQTKITSDDSVISDALRLPTFGDQLKGGLNLNTGALEFDPAAIKSNVSMLQAATAQIKSTYKATKDQIQKVKKYTQKIHLQTQAAMSQTTQILNEVTSVGGVLPGNPLQRNANRMLRTTTHTSNLSNLTNMHYLTARMMKNLR